MRMRPGWQAGFVDEQLLPGGFVTGVVRAGNTVRRTPPEDPEFVRALLDWFERHRWDGAPRFLGTDEQGREVLSYRLREAGAARDVRDSFDWVTGHRAELAAHLRGAR
jgi:hypothetical protein